MPVTHKELKSLLLSLPESKEMDHMGRPSFRVEEKIFATVWPKENKVVLKLSKPNQEALLLTEPDTFSENSWSKHGWTDIDLDNISQGQLKLLAAESWRLVAPKKIVKQHPEIIYE